MSLSVELPGFSQQKIELQAGFWGNSLKVNGEKAPKGSGKLEFLVKDDEGTEQTLTLKPKGIDLPVLSHNGEEYYFAKPVPKAAMIFAAILFIPLFAGGALGGGLAGGGFMLSMQMFRSDKSTGVQYLMALACAAAAWVTYLMVAGGITSLIG